MRCWAESAIEHIAEASKGYLQGILEEEEAVQLIHRLMQADTVPTRFGIGAPAEEDSLQLAAEVVRAAFAPHDLPEEEPVVEPPPKRPRQPPGKGGAYLDYAWDWEGDYACFKGYKGKGKGKWDGKSKSKW